MALDFKKLSNFDWRVLKRYFNAEAVKDLDRFLDALPRRTGKLSLIAAAVMWTAAAIMILFAYTKSLEMTDIQKKLQEAEALTPSVPKIESSYVPDSVLQPFVQKMNKVYPNIRIDHRKGSKITIQANSTKLYTQWRAAIDHFAYGNGDWRVGIEEMCAGRECDGMPLMTTIRIEKVSITLPNP